MNDMQPQTKAAGKPIIASAPEPTLAQLCEDVEAFETDPWSVTSILAAEILTPKVWDPCAGKGVMGLHARARGHDVFESDIVDWTRYLRSTGGAIASSNVVNFLTTQDKPFVFDWTCFMNPPFSLACEFVDRAQALGARKIVCFQRWSWRESQARRQWWRDNAPARIWLCGDRATCWRFDVPERCRGAAECCKGQGRGAMKCRQCMAGTPTSHAYYVWERGHKPTEIINVIWKV